MDQESLLTMDPQAEGHALALAQGCPQELAGHLTMAYAEGVKRGRLQEAREILLHLGTREFGTPDVATAAWVMNLNNLDRMRESIDRILDPVSFSLNWGDFRQDLSRELEWNTQAPPAPRGGPASSPAPPTNPAR